MCNSKPHGFLGPLVQLHFLMSRLSWPLQDRFTFLQHEADVNLTNQNTVSEVREIL
jgi:hypothetical protein